MSAKHTPGPWSINGIDSVLSVSGNCTVAKVWQAGADARLIAAAPEMLAALEASRAIVTQHNLLSTATDAERRATIDRLIDWMNGPRLAAIAKATGGAP